MPDDRNGSQSLGIAGSKIEMILGKGKQGCLKKIRKMVELIMKDGLRAFEMVWCICLAIVAHELTGRSCDDEKQMVDWFST